jgi:hypothetical protein
MKKAIKFFEEEITRLENAPKINGCEMTDEWAEQIEICKTAKSAIEKQILKKLEYIDGDPDRPICPTCKMEVNELEHHCDCGQALDWSDTE